MNYRTLHDWQVHPSQAILIQDQLRTQLRFEPLRRPVKLIAGADISFNRFSDTVFAAFIVLDAQTMKPVAQASAVAEVHFPYIPGLLSFREIPALLAAWSKLRVRPDVVIFDGQGTAHPRRVGIAAHMGLLIDLPSIGCGKTKLIGEFSPLSQEAGAISPLIHRGEKIGAAFRTKAKTNPVFISPGHRITLEDSLKIVRNCVRGYRIPEPTRLAHILVNQLRVEANSQSHIPLIKRAS